MNDRGTIDWTYVEFGTLLRRRRRAGDLTQEALARRADCSEHTVKKLEQGLRRPSRAMAESLARALGMPAEEQLAFVRAGTGEDDDGATATPAHAAPPSTMLGGDTMTVQCWNSFIGREADLDAVPRLLERCRLVTLHGPGGVGKSRLAAEVARRETTRPTLWVEFKHLDQATSVDHPVARSLRIGESTSIPLRQAIVARLRSDEWLVALDNCEGRVEEIAELCAALLIACPCIRILVTSRVLTYLTGEARWPLRGLDRGSGDGGRSEAVALFVDRATAIDPTLDERIDRPTSTDRRAVESICRQLDGLPLAIELAAARTDLYPPDVLADRIRNDRRLLSTAGHGDDPRYDGLTEMVLWSYDLLDDDEQHCLRAVSTFHAPFGVEAAHAVAWPDRPRSDFEPVFARLVGSSLVSRSPSDRTDFHVPEIIRTIALEMVEPDESRCFRRRHAGHFAGQAERFAPALWSGSSAPTLAAVSRRHAEFTAAVDWSCRHHDAATARRLTGALFRYWDIHGHLLEGLELCRRACDLDAVTSPEIDARAENALGTLAVLVGDPDTAVAALRTAASTARAAGIGGEHSYALVYLGLCASFDHDALTAPPILLDAARVAREGNESAMEGWAHVFLGAALMRIHQFGAAKEVLLRAEELLTDLDDEGVAWTLVGQAAHALMTSSEPCIPQVATGLISFVEMRAGWGTSVAGMLAGITAARIGRTDLAAALLATTDRLRDSVGAANLPVMDDQWRAELVAVVDTVESPHPPDVSDADPLDLIHEIDELFHSMLDCAS